MVWVEIYDDAPAMGDRYQYRQVMKELFIEGKDASEIYYTDSDGKRQPLSERPSDSNVVPQSAIEKMRAMRAEAEALRAQNLAED